MITEINLAEYYLKKREIAEYFTDENKTDAEAIADAINNAVNTGVAQSNSNTSYTPTVNSNTSGSYKIGSIKLNGTTYDIYGKDTDTKYSDATTTQKGLMSSNDKAKLDGLNAGNIPFTKNNDTWGNTSADNIKSALDSLKNSCNSLQNAINNLPTPIYYDGDNSTIKKDTNNKFYIPDKSITNAKLADTTIQTGKIQNNAITSDKINNSAITENKIQNNAVTNDKIAQNAVGTNEIINKSITNDKIADTTIGKEKLKDVTSTITENSENLITSGAVYNALNSPSDTSRWLPITEYAVDGSYGQHLFYNPFTGMVELWMRTPYRTVQGTYTPGSYLIGKTQTLSENNLASVNSLNNVNLAPDVRDYAPKYDIHTVARGSTTEGTTNCVATLDSGGKLWLKSFDGSTLVNKRYDIYFTYRCKLNRS